ncbi:MAG: hypothetical protein ACPL68_04665, partial [Candidatus Hydrothermia bacterium]
NYQGTTPTAHLVWEERKPNAEGTQWNYLVRYGPCNLNTLTMAPVDSIDGSWNLPGNGELPFAYPDIELKGAELWTAFLKEGFGLMIWKKTPGAWAKVYYTFSQSFSKSMADYRGFDLGIAPPGSPPWPFLAFAYKGEQVYLASYNGTSWGHFNLSGIVGASTVSEPAVSWSGDTALVTWKGTEGLSNYLKGLLVTKNGWTGVSVSPGTLNFPAHDPHVLYENGYMSMIWEEANPSAPPAYWIKWKRWIPTEFIRPPVGITPTITGPIGGDYTVHYTTDACVKELWFLLSYDNGNIFPDTLSHIVSPQDTDSLVLAMPDYPTKALRVGVVWKDTSGAMNFMVIPTRSVIASSSPFLTYGNNSKKIIASQEGELHLVYSTGNPFLSVWPPGTCKVFWTKSQDYGENWNPPTLLGQGYLPGLAIRSFPNGEEALACAWLRPDSLGTLDLMYSYKKKNATSWSSPVSLGKINYLGAIPGVAIDPKGKKVHIAVDDYEDGTKLHELLYFSGKYDKPQKIKRAVITSWTAALPPKDTIIYPIPMPAESLPADTPIMDTSIVVPVPLCPSVAVDYNGGVHMAWDDRAQGIVYYGYKGPQQANWTVLQISHPGRYARNPSLDVYGAQVYITWEEDEVYFQHRGYVDQPMSFMAEDTLFTYEPMWAYPFTAKGAGVAWNWWSKQGMSSGVDFARYFPSQDTWERDSIRVFMGLSRSNPSFETYWDKSKAFDWLMWTSSFVSHFYNLLPPESTFVPPRWPMANPVWYFLESQAYSREMADVPAFYALWFGTKTPIP